MNLLAFLYENFVLKETITAAWNYIRHAGQQQFIRSMIFYFRYFSSYITDRLLQFSSVFCLCFELLKHHTKSASIYFRMEMEFYRICCSARFHLMFCKRAERYRRATAILCKSPQGGELSVIYQSESFLYI